MQQHLNKINDIGIKFGEASGAVAKVELLMRVIAEKYLPVQEALTLIMQKVKKGMKIRDKKYYNCKLEYLEEAILNVFQDKIEESE